MDRWHDMSDEARATFWRMLKTMNVTRVVIALVLLVYMSFDSKGARPPLMYSQACITYLIVSILFAVTTVYLQRRFMAQLTLQVAVDIGLISLLYFSTGGVRSGLVILYLF